MFLNNWLNNCPRCVTSSLLLLLSAVTAEGQRVLSWSSACRTSNRYTGQINTKTASWDRFWGQDRGIIIQCPYGIAWHKMYHVKRQRQKIDKTATAKMAFLRVLSWNKNFKISNKNAQIYGHFCMKSCNKNVRNSDITWQNMIILKCIYWVN